MELKRVDITLEEANSFIEQERGVIRWQLVEFPDPDGDGILVGIVHRHARLGLKAHKDYLKPLPEEQDHYLLDYPKGPNQEADKE